MGMRKKRRGGECTAKIKLDEAGNFLQQINNQTHAPSKTKSGKAKVRENIKRRATETQDPAQVILGIEHLEEYWKQQPLTYQLCVT